MSKWDCEVKKLKKVFQKRIELKTKEMIFDGL